MAQASVVLSDLASLEESVLVHTWMGNTETGNGESPRFVP